MSDTTITDAVPMDEVELARTQPQEDVVTSAVQALGSGQALAYSSIQGDDFESKLAVLSAITDSSPISENLGKTIQLVDLVVQVIDLTDPQTGELTRQPRIILVDADGVAYHAISSGMLRSLSNLIGVLGQPATWPTPVPVTVKSAKARVGSYFTLQFGAAKKQSSQK